MVTDVSHTLWSNGDLHALLCRYSCDGNVLDDILCLGNSCRWYHYIHYTSKELRGENDGACH